MGVAREVVYFHLFGALRVRRGDRDVPLGARQQRLLLALLLARPGEPVGLPELIDLLWADRPPRSAANVVYRYVGALRRLLEPELSPRSEGRWLHGEAGSYVLRVDAGSLDLLAFRDGAGRGRRAGESGRPEEGLDELVAALDLWRDEAAGGLGAALQTHPTFVALENERTAAVLEAARLARQTRRPWLALPALRRSADRHPLDEALQAELMLLLAADGKQAESFARYRQVSELLADQLGVDPGPGLQAARQAVLLQEDGHSERTAATAARRPAPADSGAVPESRTLPRPAQLPTDHPYFAGRRAAVQDLVSRAQAQTGAVPVLGIDGIPGVGKTTLAVRVAHLVAGDYPDGQLYMDLRGFDPHRPPVPPREALQDFLSALGVATPSGGGTTDALSALYRSALAERRVLVLLDNADDAEQVSALLPGNTGCLVLVTSRSRLFGLATSAGAYLLTLDEPDRTEAREMFVSRVGRERADAEAAALDAIIERCGRLPIALALVNARAADEPLPTILAELTSERHSLAAFADENLDNDLRAVFSWSYRRLTPGAARLFRLLSLHPGSVSTLASAAALIGEAESETRGLLGELMRTRLATQHRRLSYRLHVLVQAYAAELAAQLDPDDETSTARRRLCAFYLRTAQRAQHTIESRETGLPGPDFTAGSAMEWFTTEYDVLRAVISDSAARGDTLLAGQLVLAMQEFHKRYGWFERWRDVATPALAAAAGAGDEESAARLERSLGGALYFLGDNDGALARLRSAQRRFGELGMDPERAHVLTNMARVLLETGQYDEALQHHRDALPLLRDHGMQRVEAAAFYVLADYQLTAGRPHEADQSIRQAIALYQEAQDFHGVAICDTMFARIALAEGRLPEALQYQQRGIDRLRGTHYRSSLAEALVTLGNILDALGQAGPARAAWQDAVEQYDDPNVPGPWRRPALKESEADGAG